MRIVDESTAQITDMFPYADQALRLTASSATLKVFARWAPHARHDIRGACSPIPLDLSVLAAKSKRGQLTCDDIDKYLARASANIKNTVEQLDHVFVLQRQDRAPKIAIKNMMERIVHCLSAEVAEVHWNATDDSLHGVDSEYDLTVVIWGALMAMIDTHGPDIKLGIEATQGKGELLILIAVEPASADACSLRSKTVPALQRIAIDEICNLASFLGFELEQRDHNIHLRRTATVRRNSSEAAQ